MGEQTHLVTSRSGLFDFPPAIFHRKAAAKGRAVLQSFFRNNKKLRLTECFAHARQCSKSSMCLNLLNFYNSTMRLVLPASAFYR